MAIKRYNTAMAHKSPWIHQLRQDRKIVPLGSDLETDVAIVGGGIAGVSTAFFILRDTDKQVVLLEGQRLGHGATGHNAGQITSYFERPFRELVEEFGLEMAAQGQRDIENAWGLFDDMYKEAELDIPFSRFTGYAGFSGYDQLLSVLKNNVLREKGGLKPVKLLIADNAPFKDDIPAEYQKFYTLVPHAEIFTKLETTNTDFVALAETEKGVVNSALFTEEVALYLLKKYPERFSIFEDVYVPKVVLKGDEALLDAGKFFITAKEVILCTNGFDKIRIFDTHGLEIDTSFHHSIHGVVARMSGYLEEPAKPPIAISYYVGEVPEFDNMEDPYFYLTRRLYEYNSHKHDLICFGGPQETLADRAEFRAEEWNYPDEFDQTTDKFIRKLYNLGADKDIEYMFTWHGLMGYTPNGVRLVGAEPRNPVLLYNLGCNGVGILPSIFGGERIAKILNGEKLPPSIFDPRKSA